MKKRFLKVLAVSMLPAVLLGTVTSCGDSNSGDIIEVSGPKGDKGETGNGISSIEKTSSDGLKDIYTIKFTDGSITTFIVTNGNQGIQGIQGEPGKDGHTPVITIGENGNWYIDGQDTGKPSSISGETSKGISSIEKTSSDGLDDIYTITFTDGTTTTFKITNEKPENPNDPVLSAYETYKKNHSEYQGTEEDWINDLIEGNLSSKIMISFDTNNGSNINPVIISAGSTLNSIEIPTREGFKFEGWKINDEIIDINSYKFNESVTLQAVWTDIRVKIDSLYLLETNDAYTVLGVDDNHPSNITIPSTYDNKNIISISSDAFKNINDIKSIKFGKNIQNIDSNAFKGCNALENVFFEGSNDEWNNITNNALVELANVDICFYSEENPTIDGKYWHYDEGGETPIIWNELRYGLVNNEYVVLGLGECKNKDIVIPRMYKGKKVTGIGAMAFYNCTNLETIELPDTIKSIETAAFLQCTNLKSIKIPKGLTSIKAEAFDECRSLTNIELPTSVTYIEGTILRGCASLTSITLPIIELDSQLEGYMTTLFGWYTPQNLSEVIINKATTITSGAFENICTEMKRIVLPDNVVSIDDCAFRGCYSLESINIPTSVTSIGEHAFSYCRSLTSIEIPANVESIGEGAFSECIALTVIKVAENNTKYNSKNNCNAIIETEGKKLIAGCCNTILPDDIKIIGNYAFASLDTIESIVLPNSVTYIGNYAFYNCQNLRNVVLSNNLISIGECAFELCDKLNKIEIPNGLISIGKEAFSGCGNLRNIEIPDSVTSIGEHAFGFCRNLENIKLPFIGDKLENPTSTMFSYVFYEDYIKNIIITKAFTIGENAFLNCTNLTSIQLPDSIIGIERGAFSGCTNLTSIKIPDSLTYIGESVFRNCNSLQYNEYDNAKYLGNENNPYLILVTAKSIDIVTCVIDEKCKFIDTSAFAVCFRLTSVTIGNSVTSIGESAFSGCSGLASIEIPESVTSIGGSAFSGCNSLTRVYYKGTKEQWNTISIGYLNDYLISATRYYYSETEPTDGDNLYWHYDDDGITPILWLCQLENGLEYINVDGGYKIIGIGSCKDNDIIVPETYNGKNIISIGTNAFSNCTNLTSIQLPDSIIEIEKGAFIGCSNLINITIPFIGETLEKSTNETMDYFFEGVRYWSLKKNNVNKSLKYRSTRLCWVL